MGQAEKEKCNLPADSLKSLAGGWSKKDASKFLESIKSCEQIDEEMRSNQNQKN